MLYAVDVQPSQPLRYVQTWRLAHGYSRSSGVVSCFSLRYLVNLVTEYKGTSSVCLQIEVRSTSALVSPYSRVSTRVATT